MLPILNLRLFIASVVVGGGLFGGGGITGAPDTGSGTNQEIAYWVGVKLGGSSLLTYDTTLGEVKALSGADSRFLAGTSDLTSHAGLYPSFGTDINGATADDGDFDLVTHSNSFSSGFISARSRGTHSAPTAVQSGDQLLDIEGDGWNGTIFFGSAASIRAYATETFSAGHFGTKITLNTFHNANAGANAWTFDQDGSTTTPTGMRQYFDGVSTNYLTDDATGTNRAIITADTVQGAAWLQATTNNGANLVCGSPNNTGVTGLGQTLPSATDSFCSAFAGDFYLLASAGSANAVRLKADGGWGLKEQTAPAGASGYAVSYADSTSHTRKDSFNGDAFDDGARVASSGSAGDTTESAGTLTTATSTPVQIGNYQCHGSVVLSESVSTDGAKCALTKLTTTVLGSRSQGSAILTSTTANTGDAAVDHGASMNPSVSLSVFPAGTCVVDAFLSVTTAGTVGLQIAQAAHTTGTITGFAGANLLCTRM